MVQTTNLFQINGQPLIPPDSDVAWSYNDCPLVHDLYGDCQIEPLTRLNQLPAAGPTEYKELLICNYL